MCRQKLANQFEQPIYQLVQHLRIEGGDPLAKTIDEIVRICEIFTHEGFGSMSSGSTMVDGNPAFCV